MQHRHIATRRVVTTLLLALALGARVASAGSISIQWDPNVEIDVQGYRVFIGTQTGVYSHSVDVGNTTTFVFNDAQAGQRYCFAVAAYSPGPLLGAQSVEVCSDSSGDEPPTLKNPGSRSNQVGVALTLQLEGADPESSPVTYSASGLPTGLTINTNTGFISGTPTAVGTFNVRATVSDGDRSTTQLFAWTIGAALPGVATPLRPSGSIATATPMFEWESVATATSYRLWVDDSSKTDPKIQLDYTPAQAGCSTAGAVCHVNPGVVLSGGRASWSVRVSNASGPGPWSGAMDFTVPDGKVPTVAIVAPTGNPTFATTGGTIALSGTATDDLAVTQVTWTNNRGGSGTATGTTTWSAAPIPLLGGSNILTITARDATGNVATDVLTVTRSDSGAPTVSIVTPTAAASYTTAQSSVNLSGSASDDAGVTKVTWTNDRGGSGTAAGTTSWSVAGVVLRSGANVITVSAVDTAGNRSSDSLTVTMTDAGAPAVAIVAPTSAATFSTSSDTVALGGTASDTVGVTAVTWANDRGGNGTASGTANWSVAAVGLKAGVNVITVTARDASGNTSVDALTVTMTDNKAPAVLISAPTTAAAFSTGAASVALGGTASDSFGVTQVTWATDKGASGVAEGTSSWIVANVPLAAGVTVITVTAKDAAGYSSTDVLTVTRPDATAPTIDISSPSAQANFSTTSATIALGGTAADNTGVTQVTWANSKGGGGTASGTATWVVAGVALQPGVNVITVTARDAAGNKATATISVRVSDVKAPNVRITGPSPDSTFSTAVGVINLEGTSSDDFGPVRVSWVSDRGASGVANGDARWIAGGVALQPGVNVITVTARDAAGNADTDVVRITHERGLPTIQLTSPTTAASYNSSSSNVALSGVASDETGVARVTWTTDKGQVGVATGTTAWSIPAITLQPGTATIVTVTAHDASGNTTSLTLNVTYADSAAPTVKIYSPTTAATFSTAASSVTIGGTANDDIGVTQVSWSNSRGGSGAVFGTNSWTALAIPVASGANVLTVTARDAAGNQSVAVLTVTSTATSPSGAGSAGPRTPTTQTQTTQTNVEAADPAPAPPTVRILAPSTSGRFNTTAATIAVAGVASHASGITVVRWATDQGEAGVAAGTSQWTVPAVSIKPGTARMTVTAFASDGGTTSVVLRVVRPEPLPKLSLAFPTADSQWTTGNATVALRGTATDNVTRVAWSSDSGATGVATGTGAWAIAGITLQKGVNRITLTAQDANGRTDRQVLKIAYRPQAGLNAGVAQQSADRLAGLE